MLQGHPDLGREKHNTPVIIIYRRTIEEKCVRRRRRADFITTPDTDTKRYYLLTTRASISCACFLVDREEAFLPSDFMYLMHEPKSGEGGCSSAEAIVVGEDGEDLMREEGLWGVH